ncbi:MAG: hypothetical protein GY861_06895 [bacterium]|nr:hypothetical protein [bacterium]
MKRAKTKFASVKLGMLMLVALSLLAAAVYSLPSGPSIDLLGNSTKAASGGGMFNQSTNDSAGGYIFYVNLSTTQQNMRWKAFVGNVTGKLTLDDANDKTIYDWTLSSLQGEVYATRESGSINWTGIACAPVNATEEENTLMNHSSPDDNITATFDGTDHTGFEVGTVSVSSCRTTNVYVNDSKSLADTKDDFEEVLLYDKTAVFDTTTDVYGNLIYASLIEENEYDYRNGSSDFQMLVAEGSGAWAGGATAYYFYVELS